MAETKIKIPYVRLGKSGLKVSKIILGTMQYGDPRWQPWVIGDEEEVIRHIKTAYRHYCCYDAGIQTFDTANVYSNGISEILLGKAIKKLNLPRDEIVILTKLNGTVVRNFEINFFASDKKPDEVGYVNQHGLSRKHIFDSVKHSLERLQLDYIDLLQFVAHCAGIGHRFDKETPIEETMQALHDVVQAGYVRYIGMSSCYAWQFHAMQNYAIANKLTPFISMQNHYSLVYREEEREMLPTLKHFGVGSIPWSPLARGLLTRPLTEKTTRGDTDRSIGKYLAGTGTEEILRRYELFVEVRYIGKFNDISRVEEVAKKRGISMAQVSIAWVLSKDEVTAPIVGTTSLKNLEDIIEGAKVALTPEEIKYLEEPYKTQAIIGHS
ncbi:aryl-alcohol dehydrogenase [Macrolepiota fuliginosa MF-IS2]|uniref:Aryl-alcohol dehydrogenase n=1 Tax=Macrolepiota fuliginosa MF-IS2 TaxID=1400762 RepID=A0A9P6C5R6_9AGAR|nr:aryl-alcohol dehydrogenase [Macrolepiota fuliginosa MF-IS2]